MNKKLKLWELNRKTEDEFRKQKKFSIVVVLDDIRSLNNIGSFFRTADAFNIEKIILLGITATPPHRDIHKTALGSTETVRWEHQEDKLMCLKELKNKGYELCVLEQTEKTTLLQEVSSLPNRPTALIFGNEVNGVAQELIDFSDRIIEIPQFGTKHSLNVSVCAGIVMWEFCKKHIE
ncbi:MAG: RNA methyltransferase [Crocinitomicaceae bacterium]|jgi:23S rRNA (guanosine2251-2'-O)-methyltransferase|nr:RNA methyltransferase [Flavobacteriales bacterium]MDB4340444.1 RNA methyltransferase [Crocinitomicaceae bacterium]MDO7613506.1 RNA methyltransferase [Crocinitomicaceae bacterium]